MDEKFEENVNGAYENGIEVGVYFRLSAITDDEAAEDAQFVLDTIGPLKDKISAPVALVLAQPNPVPAPTVRAKMPGPRTLQTLLRF